MACVDEYRSVAIVANHVVGARSCAESSHVLGRSIKLRIEIERAVTREAFICMAQVPSSLSVGRSGSGCQCVGSPIGLANVQMCPEECSAAYPTLMRPFASHAST